MLAFLNYHALIDVGLFVLSFSALVSVLDLHAGENVLYMAQDSQL